MRRSRSQRRVVVTCRKGWNQLPAPGRPDECPGITSKYRRLLPQDLQPLQRPVAQPRLRLHVHDRELAPGSAVAAVVPIVAHDEDHARGNPGRGAVVVPGVAQVRLAEGTGIDIDDVV